MRALLMAGVVLSASLIAGFSGAVPVAPAPLAPAPITGHDAVMALLHRAMREAGTDQLPPTALVNGKEVPTGQALALLRLADVPLPRATSVVTPSKDVGAGAVVPGSPPCTPGGVAVAALLSFGAPSPAFAVSGDELQPGPVCRLSLQNVQLDVETWLGDATGRPADGALLTLACVIGTWAVAQTFCHLDDFSAVSYVGHVGAADLVFRFPFNIYLNVGLILGGSPDYPAVVATLA